jgi:alginate O-acetyltransferase complex protein AlgI
MVFSSIVFLCAFLPIVLVLDWRLRSTTHKNIALTVASVLFYAYGEPRMVALLLLSTALNYVLGRLVESGRARRKEYLIAGIVCNLLLLVVFKYLPMIVGTINALFRAEIVIRDIPLPLGISFYTFQALSYVIDVYRGDVACQKTFYKVLLYISFFPQLVAGPIVKYHDFDYQIDNRHASVNDMATGLRRFGLGLAKKVLLADVFASCADALFALPKDQLFAPAAWLAAFAYMMQIYMDFSAYSDMAIGMAAALGFRIPENFRHPYASLSMREFWRRWHISLSGWFREYLYIPLGGNRKGKARTYINLIIVFFLTGFWHGAGFTFIFWGLYHGFFTVIERL